MDAMAKISWSSFLYAGGEVRYLKRKKGEKIVLYNGKWMDQKKTRKMPGNTKGLLKDNGHEFKD